MVTAFKKFDGVTECKVDFKAKTATVDFDPSKTDKAKVIAALKETRFTAKLPEEKKKDEKKTEKKTEKKGG